MLNKLLGVDVRTSDPLVINERLVLSEATLLKARRIVIGEAAVIVTNGFFLSLKADEVAIAGQPEVRAYVNRVASLDGRNAGTIMIRSQVLTGDGTLKIFNNGEDGALGAAGAGGAKGPKGGQGTQRDWNAWNGCHGGSNGGGGGVGGRGGDGGPGGNGGQGGDVILQVVSGLSRGAGDKRLVIVATGGQGANGGSGGPGGPGGDGGDGAPGTFYCGGTHPGPPGPQGPGGGPGPTGRDGQPGKVTVLSSGEEAAAFFN